MRATPASLIPFFRSDSRLAADWLPPPPPEAAGTTTSPAASPASPSSVSSLQFRSSCVSVEFTRSAAPSAAAPAGPIWFPAETTPYQCHADAPFSLQGTHGC